MIAVSASVVAVAALVGAAIAVTAAFLQWLRQWRWLATAIVAAVLAQRLRCSNCGGSVGAAIAVVALAQ